MPTRVGSLRALPLTHGRLQRSRQSYACTRDGDCMCVMTQTLMQPICRQCYTIVGQGTLIKICMQRSIDAFDDSASKNPSMHR